MAASITVRAIGPAVSWLWPIGTMPRRDTSAIVDLRPTTPLTFAGPVIEPLVSVPMVPAAKLIAAEMPEPELEPAGVLGEVIADCARSAADGRTIERGDVAPPGPLGQVGLAEDHRAGGPQAFRHFGILGGLVVGKGIGTGGGRHAHGVDIVLD